MFLIFYYILTFTFAVGVPVKRIIAMQCVHVMKINLDYLKFFELCTPEVKPNLY